MITANDLKTKGIACFEESVADKTEDVITVRGKRGKECFVVMKIEQYHYLREMALEAAPLRSQPTNCLFPEHLLVVNGYANTIDMRDQAGILKLAVFAINPRYKAVSNRQSGLESA